MSISSNPVLFKNSEEEETSAVNNQTQALLQKPVSFVTPIEKPETEAQKILKQEKFVSAADILKQEKITAPKNVLKGMQFPTATTILETEGFESAADILAIEKREREKFKKKQQDQLIAEQQEAEFLKLQDEYIQNIDPNNFKLPGQNIYETKFGELDFDQSKFMGGGNNFSYSVKVNDKDLVFVPQEFVYKGASYDADAPGASKFLEKSVSIFNKDFLNDLKTTLGCK